MDSFPIAVCDNYQIMCSQMYQWPKVRIIRYCTANSQSACSAGNESRKYSDSFGWNKTNPTQFLIEPAYAELTRECLRLSAETAGFSGKLSHAMLSYPLWGREGIDNETIMQIDQAMKLPISVAGAPISDAHVGYGLPIGVCWPLKTL